MSRLLPAPYPTPIPSTEERARLAVWTDPQVMRVFTALAHRKALRNAEGKPLANAGAKTYVYAVAYQLNADGKGDGRVSIGTVIEWMKSAGVTVSAHTIRTRWIGHEQSPFWRRHGDYLYLTGYNRLCKLAVELAYAAGCPDLVDDDLPGASFIEVPAASTLTAWFGHLLAAWHNHRANTRIHNARISRAKLERLWGVSRRILRKWERAAGIKTGKAYRVIADNEHIPPHAYPALFVEDNRCVVKPMARHSNRYNAPTMRQKQHKRTPRTGRWYARRALEASQSQDDRSKSQSVGIAPAVQQSAHTALSSQGRLNFYAPEDMPAAVGKAFKTLKRHLRRHSDYEVAHHVCLGVNLWGTALYEQSSDGIQRTQVFYRDGVIVATNRAPRHIEDAFFAKHGGRGSYVAAYREGIV